MGVGVNSREVNWKQEQYYSWSGSIRGGGNGKDPFIWKVSCVNCQRILPGGVGIF